MSDYVVIGGKRTNLSTEQTDAFRAILADGKKLDAYTPGEVSEIVKSGRAREYFKVHDVLKFGDLELEVIGFDHDRSEDVRGRPTMTVIGKKVIARRPMHSGGDCPRGWVDTDRRKWLNTEAFNALSEELRAVIVPVLRYPRNYEGEAFPAVDRLFVPSESEVFGSAIWSNEENGSRYEGFDTSEHRVRYDEDGDPCPFWCLSSHAGSASAFAFVTSNGFPDSLSAATSWIGAPLCFCF